MQPSYLVVPFDSEGLPGLALPRFLARSVIFCASILGIVAVLVIRGPACVNERLVQMRRRGSSAGRLL